MSTPDPNTQKRDFRINILEEILVTEREYNRDLRHFQAEYINKLKDIQKNPPVDSRIEKLVVLLDNISALISISNAMLEELELIEKDPNKKGLDDHCLRVSEVFIKYAPLFKSYSGYASEYRNMLKLFKDITEDKMASKEFNEVGLSFYKNPATRLLDAEAFLIKPVQRVLKYPLLLKELLKKTSSEESSYSSTSNALQETSSVAGVINELQRRYDAEAAVAAAEDSLKSLKKAYDVRGGEEDIKARSVEVSNKNNFFKRSLINKKALLKLLVKRYPSESIPPKVEYKGFTNKKMFVVITQGGKEYKFQILKGKAGEKNMGDEENKSFHVRIENESLRDLPEDKLAFLYKMASEIGSDIIKSMRNADAITYNVFSKNNPGEYLRFKLPLSKNEVSIPDPMQLEPAAVVKVTVPMEEALLTSGQKRPGENVDVADQPPVEKPRDGFQTLPVSNTGTSLADALKEAEKLSLKEQRESQEEYMLNPGFVDRYKTPQVRSPLVSKPLDKHERAISVTFPRLFGHLAKIVKSIREVLYESQEINCY